MTESKKVCFSMSGKWFADFARTRLEEGAWDRALALLVDTMGGMTHDQAIAILKGEATLTGDSSDEKGIGFRKLSPKGKLAKAMRERLDYMYGDMFRYNNRVYRPYAVVFGWDRHDYNYAMKGHTTKYLDLDNRGSGFGSIVSTGMGSSVSAGRSLYYAHNPTKDLLVFMPPMLLSDDVYTGDVLCEEVATIPPFWYALDTNKPFDSITRILKGRKLPVYGADTGLSRTVTKDDPAGHAVQQEAAVDEAARIPAPTSSSDEAQEKQDRLQRRQLAFDTIEACEAFLNSTLTEYKEVREWSKTFEGMIDSVGNSIPADDTWDRIEAIRDGFTKHSERLMGERVNAQAEKCGGFIELPLYTDYANSERYNPPTLRVPKNAFYRWAIPYIDFAAHGHPEIEWETVAGSGWKMVNDNPFHTDWMLGAGVPLDETYKHVEGSFAETVLRSAYRHRDTINKEITGHQFTVLTRNKDIDWFYGEVVKPEPNNRVKPGSIAVVPNAGPEYQMAMETACMEAGSENGRRGLIICETGGKLAHLVTVGREFKCTVLMIPNAMAMYREGQRVSIDMEEGTIETCLM